MSSELRARWSQAGGRIPEHWDIVTLESLLKDGKSIAVGVMYPGPDTEGGTPLIKVGDIKGGIIAGTPTYRISPEVNQEHKRTQLLGDELLITLVGNPGECVVVTQSMIGWNPARAIAVVRLANPNLRVYLKTVLESAAGKHLIDAVLNTTVQKTLNLKDIRQLPIPMPSIETITAISSFSEALTVRIALLRETNATLEAIAQALFKSWFVDFDPVHANAAFLKNGQAPSLPAEIQALFPSRLVESPQGLIPEGWAYVNLGELVCNQSTTFKFDGVENVVFVNTGDVSEGVFLHQNYVPVSGLPGQAKKAIKRDDILFSEIRPKNKRFAYVNVEPKDYVVSTKFMVLRAISDISPRYIYQILKQDPTIDFFNVIAESRSGTFPQITFDSIKNFQVLRPSKVCVDKFIDTLQPIIEQIDLNAERQKEFSALRDTLLPRLISGQLRLPEAEAVLAEVG